MSQVESGELFKFENLSKVDGRTITGPNWVNYQLATCLQTTDSSEVFDLVDVNNNSPYVIKVLKAAVTHEQLELMTGKTITQQEIQTGELDIPIDTFSSERDVFETDEFTFGKFSRAGLDPLNVRGLREAYNLLKVTDHPSIIKIHGLAKVLPVDYVDNGVTSTAYRLGFITDRVGKYLSPSNIQIEIKALEQVTDHQERRRQIISMLKRLEPAAGVLSYVHAAGVIHRDVKPANFFVDENGKVILGDFGLSLYLDDTNNITLGTPKYLPPEQIDDSTVSAAADSYSMFTTALEPLTVTRKDAFYRNRVQTDQQVVYMVANMPLVDESILKQILSDDYDLSGDRIEAILSLTAIATHMTPERRIAYPVVAVRLLHDLLDFNDDIAEKARVVVEHISYLRQGVDYRKQLDKVLRTGYLADLFPEGTNIAEIVRSRPLSVLEWKQFVWNNYIQRKAAYFGVDPETLRDEIPELSTLENPSRGILGQRLVALARRQFNRLKNRKL